MKIHFGRFAAAVLAAAMMCSALSADAADAPKIVVIGDSISTGAMLAEGESSYVELVQQYTGAQITNFAQDSYTTQDVIDCLGTAQVQAALADADYVFVTVGIHDIMDPFYAKANEIKEKYGFESFDQIFTARAEDYGITDAQMMTYAADLSSAIKLNREAARDNLLTIGGMLSQYENAQVVYQTVYNCLDKPSFYDSMGKTRKNGYDSSRNIATSTMRDYLNASLTSVAEQYSNSTTADVFTGFAEKAYIYTNLESMDVNPNAQGHAWIAAEVLAAAGLLQSGDVNGDSKVDALDAAAILVHCANEGAGKSDGLFNDGQRQAADFNGDHLVDANDAAAVLVYSAAQGAGL